MRRGPGIAALDRSAYSSAQYSLLGDSLTNLQLTELRSQLDTFANALRSFASSHRNDIRRDPAFRHAFQKMCVSIGVDPLAGAPSSASGASSRGGAAGKMAGLWNNLLGLGDWQYELGIQVVDVCISTRHLNGGLIEMQDMINRVTLLRTGKSVTVRSTDESSKEALISEEDVIRSVKTLQPLGAGYEVVTIGAKRFVRSVPKELDTDSTVILAILSATNSRALRDVQGIPYITLDSLMPPNSTLVAPGLGAGGKSAWTEERAIAALQDMSSKSGMLWVDEGTYPVRYYSLGVAEGIWSTGSKVQDDCSLSSFLAESQM
ncbi:winged helix DNA-binding domain-containing protein [Tilletiaria anomala UBC 951]|uniref:Winged helix DNA-binding domain-containing protein n=1 Tax=Tilletiaria anomala (strain ATCC 24038 / CBS 436.72 / UBC 951) TaxID=1037660 RepID=A0A066W086_TILAU|nr:winged helix DNA-binding domain-containing protein [Tilletiaria anomala UBC 951]KDN45948.1 winged helix DNA-binding domain-containing protein [Tilletiaria anomala UBC 951]